MPAPEVTWCANCDARKVYAGGECRPCYRYRHRHGVARPAELERRLQQRADEARFAARVSTPAVDLVLASAPKLGECAQRPFKP